MTATSMTAALAAIGLTAREIASARRTMIFTDARERTGNDDYIRAGRIQAWREQNHMHDINPRTAVRSLQRALDNFTGYCGEDDAIGDQINHYTAMAYKMFAWDFIADWRD